MAKLKVEVADNPMALARGLMGRKSLSKDGGMLFQFPMIVEASFWGKNTYIPLDIAFVNDDIVVDIKHIVPLSTKTIRSAVACTMAIEANAGFFKENDIDIGSKIQVIKNEENKEAEVIFNA